MTADVRMGCTFANITKEKYCTIPDGNQKVKTTTSQKAVFVIYTKYGVAQELRGFTYATDLDLNQVWATKTIRLDPDASRICTINFPWGKYSYK